MLSISLTVQHSTIHSDLWLKLWLWHQMLHLDCWSLYTDRQDLYTPEAYNKQAQAPL